MQLIRGALVAISVLCFGACSPKHEAVEKRVPEPVPAQVVEPRRIDQPTQPTTKSVLLLNGSVNAANADHFTKFVSDNLDAVIGVKIDVSPSDDEDFQRRQYLTSADDDMLAIFKGEGDDGGIEVVVPKGSYGWQHGHHTIDGFFVVKSGGVHQGTLSYGLEPTDEGSIRTNPGIRIVERDLK